MKSTIISMILVLCLLAIIPMFFIGDNSLGSRFGLDIFNGSDEQAKTPKNLTNVTTDKKVQVYKWRDEHGVMQFTNTPPPETRQAETVELVPDTNVVKAVKVVAQEADTKSRGPKVMSTGGPYTPAGVKELLDSTSSLADGISDQQLQQQQLMDQITRNQK